MKNAAGVGGVGVGGVGEVWIVMTRKLLLKIIMTSVQVTFRDSH